MKHLESAYKLNPNFSPQEAAEIGAEIGVAFDQVYEWAKQMRKSSQPSAKKQFEKMTKKEVGRLKHYIQMSSRGRGLDLDQRMELADEFSIEVTNDSCKEAVDWLTKMKKIVPI